jgi:hypothetical protein
MFGKHHFNKYLYKKLWKNSQILLKFQLVSLSIILHISKREITFKGIFIKHFMYVYTHTYTYTYTHTYVYTFWQNSSHHVLRIKENSLYSVLSKKCLLFQSCKIQGTLWRNSSEFGSSGAHCLPKETFLQDITPLVWLFVFWNQDL